MYFYVQYFLTYHSDKRDNDFNLLCIARNYITHTLSEYCLFVYFPLLKYIV